MRFLLFFLLALPLAAQLRVAAFRADATPDMGEPNIWTEPVKTVMDPLWAKGVVLESGGKRYVLAAVDWCGIGGSIHLMLQSRIAAAAGTSIENVALQSVHQHAAPYADGDTYEVMIEHKLKPQRMSSAYLEKLAGRLSDAVKKATASLQPFDQIGTGTAPVDRVGSERRLLINGKIVTRFSSTAKNPELAAEPEGDIDRDIRTITFARKGKPLVRLHYYASHPQTFCCDGRVSGDFLNAARERTEAQDGVPQIYFTGGGGNVTVGKYNTGKPEERTALADRMAAGMMASIKSTRYEPATSIQWRFEPLRLPVQPYQGDYTASDDQTLMRRAMKEAFSRRTRPLPASALTIGKVVIVHLPGEPLLVFQRFAQSQGKGRFVAFAGYGDISPGYLCPDVAFEQGGYEPSASNAAPGTEAAVKNVITKLMAQ